ncbi:MAG TPA: hypothetical protein VFX05_16090 [Casimicrobiaceae bacterium]|nr:hypothetical protein [Casimicrobiaceae bacterium]
MGSIAGRSAGFGRIGETTRTSLYSPVNLSSTPRAAPPSEARLPGRSRLARRIAVGVVIALVAAAAALVAGLVTRPAPSPLEAASARPAALDAEAERLDRSAFAAHRRKS